MMFSSALKSFSSNISANYTISSNPTSIAGAWKVFDGKNKKTGKVVSVFVFDRKSLEPSAGSGFRSRSNGSTKRKIFDEVVERLKKEASSLARLRHPNILELAEPIEDTKNGGLMFATEPITNTLAGLLNNQDGQDRGRSRHSSYYGDGQESKEESEIDELEIQKGLLQVAKGLEFLHESAGLVHGNLTPEAIYINAKSDWKLSGLAFCGPPDVSNTTTPSTAPPIALSELLYYDPRLPRTVQLNLDYTSPDFVMDSNISSGADMFSLGLLMLALYNSPHESPLHTNSNVTTYKKIFSTSSTVPTSSNNFLCNKELPHSLKFDVLPRLITRRPATRMSAKEFQESKFFDNILVSAIRFLESLPAKTPHEKSQFLRGLPRVLEQFPKSVLDKKVLPALLEETKDKELLALILGNVFKMIPLLPSSQRSFTDKILPKLKDIFGSPSKIAERDVAKEAGLAVVLDSIALIAENCNGKEFKDGKSRDWLLSNINGSRCPPNCPTWS
jgi:SCY1-like protein 2